MSNVSNENDINDTASSEVSLPLYDIVVIGAGIHGASMASEAASRGLKVMVVQSGHLGGASSCVPSDTVGIGLNELENLQLAELLINRSELHALHNKAPHLVRPVITHAVKKNKLRSSSRIRLGARFYKALQTFKIESSDDPALSASFRSDALETATFQEFSANYTRIAIALLQQFEQQGGVILSRHRLVRAIRDSKMWTLEMQATDSQQQLQCRCKVLVNCTGSFANNVLKDVLNVRSRSAAQSLYSAQLYVKYPQQWQHAAILQRPNRSLVYAQNFNHAHLCLGPVLAEDGSDEAKQTAIDEVLSLWNEQAITPLTKKDIIYCCWSAHPLVEDPSSDKLDSTNTTLLDLNNPGNAAPLLSLFGNNLLRYQRLAEQGMDILQAFTNAPRNVSFRSNALPGGDFGEQKSDECLSQLKSRYAFLSSDIVERLFFTYGTNTLNILDDAHNVEELGKDFGEGLYQREVDYLMDKEWATNAGDVLWRRTYLGLVFSAEDTAVLESYIQNK